MQPISLTSDERDEWSLVEWYAYYSVAAGSLIAVLTLVAIGTYVAYPHPFVPAAAVFAVLQAVAYVLARSKVRERD